MSRKLPQRLPEPYQLFFRYVLVDVEFVTFQYSSTARLPGADVGVPVGDNILWDNCV